MSRASKSGPELQTPLSPALLAWEPATRVPALGSAEIQIWIVELDAGLSPGEDGETTGPGPELILLAPEERERAARFVRARDRRRFVRCRAALRQILGGLLDEAPESLQFRAGGQGKPELVSELLSNKSGDPSLPLRFNVSHSAELALIGVCCGRELGVDIERIRELSEAGRIVGNFFSAAEQAEFATIPTDLQAPAFLRGWTRKEAILKGLGIGLAGLSANYETGFGTGELTTNFTPATPWPRVDRWRLWEAAPRAGFVAALAVHDPAPTAAS